MQNAPIAVSFCAFSNTAAVSWVRERMPTKWASLIASTSASPASALGNVSTLV
jgi:hypothetical protein